jgi:hypothetical protein
MLRKLKAVVGNIPIVGPIAKSVYSKISGRKPVTFERSGQYWEDRYQAGRTSGSGSYGRLARFKADFLNAFVVENRITTVVEFGCGDGAQLELSKYPRYIGFDVSLTAVKICQEKLMDRPSYSFHLVDSDAFRAIEKQDLSLSLDVIYHLIEDDVFHTYMDKLFATAERYVVIFAYDFDKVYGSQHERGRNFTAWIEQNAPAWSLLKHEKNPYPHDADDPTNTSQSDFFVFEKKH